MPRFQTRRRVAHKARQMFDLVADVERYPEFVPMCERLLVRRRTGEPEATETLVADMSIGYKLIRETFSTKVTLDRPALRIHVEYIDGPFSHLENVWTFRDLPAGSEVDFEIDYAFRSRAFQLLAGAVFETVFRKMAESFEARADRIYARGPGGR
jgi:coenzyme Q-binding protein COQ10